MNIKQAERLLRKYKLPYSKSHITRDVESIVGFSKKVGFPVVVKVFTHKPIHKTDVHGVKLNLKNEKQVRNACLQLSRIHGFKGYIVQKMETGHEVVVGVKQDPSFGPVIMFGYGGIYVEILKDVTFRIAPITKKMAFEMIQEIKAYPILAGKRGEPSNINSLVKILLKVSDLAKKKKFKEMDLNPIFVNGKGAIIVDARIIE